MEFLRIRSDLMKKLIVLIILSFTFAVSSLSVFATGYIQTWNLVDSGKHLDYDGNSIYMSNFRSGVNKWEGYKSGIIRPDSASVIEDVYASDYSTVNSTNAVTSSAGTIKFNKYNMNNYTSTVRTRIATHELGHSLGLGHSTPSDIMYMYTPQTSSLTQNDKDSYNAAYTMYSTW
jgi:hypothetical protein